MYVASVSIVTLKPKSTKTEDIRFASFIAVSSDLLELKLAFPITSATFFGSD